MGDGFIIQMYIPSNPPVDRLLLPLTVPVFPSPETLQGINSRVLFRRGKVSCQLCLSWGENEILGPNHVVKSSQPILLILATPLCIPTANNLYSINHISSWLSLLPLQDSAFLALLNQLHSSFCFTTSKFMLLPPLNPPHPCGFMPQKLFLLSFYQGLEREQNQMHMFKLVS